MEREKGFSLLEVIIAIALMGIIAVAFLGALGTASKAIFIADERATAESLARSQMEYVKEQDYRASEYIPGPPPQWIDKSYLKIDVPDGYTILGFDRNNDEVEDIIGVPWDSQADTPANADAGLQKIRLVIKHHGKVIFTFIRDDIKITLEDYKVDR
jgi:prepilin-type N-terminal cleavage/methylation domain-containing protein